MKTTKVIPVILIAMVLAFTTSFQASALKPQIATPTYLQKVIKESIKYPENALKKSCCGEVDVIFSLNEDGTIRIRSMHADNADIEKGVKEQLAKISFKDVRPAFNQQYRVKITFKLT